MKPKPFWPLNHFTTPVAILLSRGANAPIARTTSVQAPIQSQRCLGEGGLGRDHKEGRSNRMRLTYSISRELQGRWAKYLNPALFGCLVPCRPRSSLFRLTAWRAYRAV